MRSSRLEPGGQRGDLDSRSGTHQGRCLIRDHRPAFQSVLDPEDLEREVPKQVLVEFLEHGRVEWKAG